MWEFQLGSLGLRKLNHLPFQSFSFTCSSAKVRNEYHVTVGIAARGSDLFAIRRQVEVADVVLFEMRELPRRAASDRLQPEIVGDARIAVDERLPIGGPAHGGAEGMEVEDLEGLATVGRQQC